MERIPEAELMDDPSQARVYAEADFEAVNTAFVEGFRQQFPDLPEAPSILDLGCGPGDIPLRTAWAFPEAVIQAVDGAAAMIELAEEARRASAVGARVRLVHCTIQALAPPSVPFLAVLSNSLLHQLHDGGALWRAIQRTGAPGTAVYVQDLRRPESPERAAELVSRYAAEEPEQLRTDFYNSLLAAFTPEEVQAQLGEAGLNGLSVTNVSDRHLLVCGTL